MSKPVINVTPLIDVLLVLLIIFMVVAPLKPGSFQARVPAEPPQLTRKIDPNPKTLVVTIDKDSSISLNHEKKVALVDDTGALVARLKTVFAERIANQDVSDAFGDDPRRPSSDRVERTTFIKAPRGMPYGSVVKVVDAVKLAGAYPVSLQIDGLD
jgi:biopolymer transport protein ExbD